MRGLAIALLVTAVAAVSVRWGSFVAGGSDSYCYIHQAERWAQAFVARPFTGRLQAPEPLALEAPWPNAPLTFAPAGHIPSPTVPGGIAPICPSGLSILMAPLVAVAGAPAAFALIPLFGAALILATYLVGARFGAPIGLGAAVLAAASPVFLYQVVQPMSDVPAAALWLLAVAGATGTKPRHVALGGIASSAAILVRPNLLPLGLAIGLFLLLRPERTPRQRLRAAALYAAASAPGCIAVALIQQAFYGSPLASGYGSLTVLFSVDHIWPNAERYLSWLVQTHTPAIALALVAPVLLPGALTALLLGLFAVNLALYLPYVEFTDWSFARFLLPTLPLVLILVVATVDAALRRIVASRPIGAAYAARAVASRIGLAILVTVLAVFFVRAAIDRSAFQLQRLEARFERAGLFVRDRLPANAFVITSWQSGSVRFYGRRKTLTWDSLDPMWLEGAIAFLRARGYEPYLMFERWEEPAFRNRFAGTPIGALDWPPAAEIGGQVRIYRPNDRARFLEGSAPPTEYAR
jgi:hypothetical protein